MNDRVEWVHFGGCVHDRIFNEGVLGAISRDADHTAPVEYVTLYRRGIAFLVEEWATLGMQPVVPQAAGDAQFLKAWCPGPDTFDQADIIFTNVVLDNLYRRQPLVGRGRLCASPVPMSRVIHNFPLEPSAQLAERFVVADATSEDIAMAWEDFLAKVTRPVVVCLLFCTRNQMPPAYGEQVYRTLHELQERIKPVFARHENALVLEVDELIDCTNPELYRDRHHLTPAGDGALRTALLARLTERGVLDRLLARRQSRGVPFAGFPDRADFVMIEDSLVDFCSRFYKAPLLIGPERVTRTMAARLEALHSRPVIMESMTTLPSPARIDGVIYLKWSQHSADPPWLKALWNQYPGVFVELVSHWRQETVLSIEERAFVGTLKRLAASDGPIACGIWSIADRDFRRYATRVLADQLFQAMCATEFDFDHYVPKTPQPAAASAEAVRAYAEWKLLQRRNVFCSRGRIASSSTYRT